jgi:hypothetical protein
MPSSKSFIHRTLSALVVVAGCAGLSQQTLASDTDGCYSDNYELRILNCTTIIESGKLNDVQLGQALASRGLGYSLKGAYESAIRDYDRSLKLLPNQSTALNNRAWAYFRWGKAADGEGDVEKSLQLNATSAEAYDTRAHIRQSLGRPDPALRDYNLAMFWGGTRFVKMYQCGLTAAGLYKGPVDGLMNDELKTALRQCVGDARCDPLPADENCRSATS